MASVKNLWQRLTKPFRTTPPMSSAIPVSEIVGKRVESAEGRIPDGASYSMPVLMPHYLRESLAASGKLEQYLQEATQATTLHFQFDSPYRSASDLPISPLTEDPLREWSSSTRQMVLSNCHSVYQRNPIANTAVQYTADFVIGEGFNLVAHNKRVQKLLDEFIEHPDNSIREYERQAVIDLQVDGELFIRYFSGRDETAGQVVAVPLRPWECVGIQTELGFFRRPQKYHFQFQLTSGDDWAREYKTENVYIEADEIQHVAINRHSYELRGRPELYRVLTWLHADKEFLENRARQNHWRNALLWFVQVADATAANIAAVAARWSRPPSPGSVAIESSKVDVKPLSNPTGGSEAAEDGRQIKLRSIIGLRLPEYMFADGYNANLASSKSQQLPAMTKFSAFQTIMVEQVWTPMFRRVLTEAVESGLLPEKIVEQDSEGEAIYIEAGECDDDGNVVMIRQPKMCRTVDCFEVSYAPLSDDSMGDLATALTKIASAGWIDRTTAQEQLGLDPALVNKRLRREEEYDRDAMAQGRKPPPVADDAESEADDESEPQSITEPREPRQVA